MSDVVAAWASAVVMLIFGVLAVHALARASRNGRSGWWAAAMFSALALYMLSALLAAAMGGEASVGIAKAGLAVLVLFPYLALMFATSFRSGHRRLVRSSAALAAIVVLPTFVLPSDGSQPSWVGVYLVTLLVYWATLSLTASTFLWKAGRGQPTVSRRRMRLMSFATTTLAICLVLSAFPGTSGGNFYVAQVGVLALLLISGVTFMLGLEPPRALVLSWRQPEDHHLSEAMIAVLRAGSPEEVAAQLLPRVTRAIGGSGAVLVDNDQRVVATHGDAPGFGSALGDVDALRGPTAHRETVPLGEGRGQLVVWTSAYTPFFGQEEVDLLRRIGAFASLALERSELLAEEQVRSAALQEAKRDAEHARDAADRANTAKSEFLSRMSHEFRTPLNAILGFGQLLESSSLTREDQEAVGHILKAGRHLLALVNDVLDLARIEAGEMTISLETVHATELIDDAVALMRPLADARSIRLLDPLEGCDDYVHTDRQRCRQILLNLLSNAVKYNHDGGEVHVTCERIDPKVLRVSVRDTGAGIDARRQQRLFEPFERLGADGSGVEGTGLGLALSRQLATAMGGNIGVESSAGNGSTFWIDLPTTAPPADTPRAGHRAEPAVAEHSSRTLLLVEDNVTNLRLVEAMLRRRPEFTVIPAMQGQMAIDLAHQHRPDVIVLDLHLPDIPGRDVLRRLQADPRTRHIPVVVATADASLGRERQLREDGAFEYITKPLDVHRFVDVVDAAVARSDSDAHEPVTEPPREETGPGSR